ncbi:MAG: hypothetical protein HZC28_16920 [Spirochaetes bacterium]|nr:hypothetical protein [Spirochaetota bacterium]
MNIDVLLLAAVTAFAILSIIVKDLIRAALALAAVSAVLAIVLYRIGSPFAAAFELSVAAGLITVLFISAISLIRPDKDDAKESLMITAGLPVASVLFAVVLWFARPFLPVMNAATGPSAPFRDFFWNIRSFDLVGQICILLVGVFIVILFFKEQK